MASVSIVSTGLAQELTLTSTTENTSWNRVTIDAYGLAGNPLAIIVATPLGETEKMNPHPIGVWYYGDKWHIRNTDGTRFVPGLEYKIHYFLRPGRDQFLHIITRENLVGEGSYIDSPALNNNPNAQLKILQNYAPDNRPVYNLNANEAKAVYSSAAGKWYIANVNGTRLFPNTAYNIVITSGGGVGSNTPLPTVTPNLPTGSIETPPAPLAPLTVVVRTTFTVPYDIYPLGAKQCTSHIYSNPSILITDAVIVTASTSFHGVLHPTVISVAGHGALQMVFCNWYDYSSYTKGIDMRNRKFNILVLR